MNTSTEKLSRDGGLHASLNLTELAYVLTYLLKIYKTCVLEHELILVCSLSLILYYCSRLSTSKSNVRFFNVTFE